MTVGAALHSTGGTSALVPMLVQKELRALGPVFLATGTLLLLCATVPPGLSTLGLGVYVLGACALGALSIGHEFTYDTLGQLLAQPGRRARLLTVKVLVLASLVALLAAAVSVRLWPSASPLAYGDVNAQVLRWPIVLIPALLAAFVAPLLTMLSRSAIAGTVFTVGVYAGLWLIAPGITSPASPNDEIDVAYYAGTMLWIAVGVSAVSAVAGAVMFRRLEFIGSHRAMAWTAFRRGVASAAPIASAPRRPAAALLLKELRLQTVSFVIAGLYVVAWALFAIVDSRSSVVIYAFEGGTLLYQFILAFMIGALPSAEERALGTLQWQTLQPYAAWKQWTVKAVTALTLTALLVIVLPAFSALGADTVDRFWLGLRVGGWSLSRGFDIGSIGIYAVVLITLTLTGLFCSTFNRNSLHALLSTALLAFVGGLAFRAAYSVGWQSAWAGLKLNKFYHDIAYRGIFQKLPATWTINDEILTNRISFICTLAAIAGFLLLMQRMGLKNHTSAEPSRATVTRQIVVLLAYGIVASLVLGAGPSALQYYLVTH